jgi:AcrR family transcriptional regulator
MPSNARADLLRVARARFLERGFGATSLDEIRREAGVSNGSLFHFFRTKNHVARALYVDAVGAYKSALLEALRNDPPARTGVDALVNAHVGWVLKNRADARVLVELRDATMIDGVALEWSSVNDETFAALRSWVKRCVDRGEMSDLPFDVWMSLVFAPVLMLTRAWAKQRTAKVAPATRRALARGAWSGVAKVPLKRKRSHAE